MEITPGFYEENFNGFSPTIRTAYFSVNNLRVTRGSNDLESKKTDHLYTTIMGAATSELDDYVEISDRDRASKTFDFSLSPHDCELWDQVKPSSFSEIEDGSAVVAFQKHLLEIIEKDQKHPTAYLGFIKEDRGVGLNNSSWYLECQVADEFIERLSDDIFKNSVVDLNIQIRWKMGLVDNRYAERPRSVSWGLITGRQGPIGLKGYVTGLSWEVGKSIAQNESIAQND
jgi:hypothetical protein